MPVAYVVQAEVIDLRTDVPQATDRLLVDTNVGFWTTYTRASQTALRYQVREYPAYISKVRSAGGTRYRCNVSFAELAHIIEHEEDGIFGRARAANASVRLKEFRHNYPSERTNIVAEVQSAWGSVSALAQPLDITLDEPTTDAAVNRMASDRVDGYDLFLLEAMSRNGVRQIMTDDGDFTTVPGIQVYTANANVIGQARTQGRLVVR